MQRSSSWRRIALAAIVIIVVLPVAALAIFIATFNPNRYKPRIVAAIEQATGRTVTIAGPLRMRLALVPTITASAITLANPPGYADPNLATLRRIEARVALLPLLGQRIDIVKLVLIDPAVTLEYGPTGTPNWLFHHNASPAGPARAPAHAASHHPIALQAVSIENGTITYKPPMTLAPLQPGITQAAPAMPSVLTITHFTGTAASLGAPLHLTMQARYNAAPFTLTGVTGPISRFTAPGGQWPVDLTFGVTSANHTATLHLKGSLAHPRHLAGYDLQLRAAIPDLAALDPYAGGIDLPPLRKVTLAARIAQAQHPSNGRLPAITDADLTAGPSNLGTWRKGLSITSFNATMAAWDQPLDVALAGQYQGKPVGLEGRAGPVGPIVAATFGRPATKPAVAPAPAARFTVNVAAKVGNARFGVLGGIANPAKLAGVALKVTARIPDLAHLSDLAGTNLPAWTNIGLSGLLTDPGGLGLARAIGVDSLAVSADQAQFGGAFSLTRGKTPDLQAVIDAPRIDLTGLLRALPKATTAQPATTGAAPAVLPRSATTSNNLIPATPLPFGLLRRGDGNVELTIGQLMYQGATYDAVTAHGLLHHGVLTVRPIDAELPGGSVSGTLRVDATANPPRVHLTEAAPAFRLAPLLTLLGLPNAAGATVQLYANLAGQGNSPRGIAATLNGSLGIASVNGEVDGALLHRLFGASLNAVGLPASMVGAQGPVLVRCFAGRLDATNGLASVRALTLDTNRMYLTGTGSLDLGAERLNLILRPQVRVAGGSTAVPIAISGTFAHPREGFAPAGAYGTTAASLARQLGGRGSVLGRIAHNLGLAPPAASPQSCTGALTLARMGHPGPMPTVAAMAPAPGAPGAGATTGAPGAGATTGAPAGGPQNLLQSLFR